MDCSLLVRPLGQQQRGALVIYSLSRQASACNWFPLILGHSMHASQTEVITWHKKTFKAFSLQSVPLWPCDALNFLLKVLQGVWRIHIACLGEWNVLCKQSKWRFIQVSVYMEWKWNCWYGQICHEWKKVFFCHRLHTYKFVTICTSQLVWKDTQA